MTMSSFLQPKFRSTEAMEEYAELSRKDPSNYSLSGILDPRFTQSNVLYF